MNSKKSAGVDGITITAIKKILPLIIEPLVYILNKCIELGVFPEHFKKAEVIPVYKKGERDKTTNYRPISLISNFGKIFEKVLKLRFDNFTSTHNIINSLQFGFQTGKGTEDAIKVLLNAIIKAIDCNIPIITIFLDLAKAFDTVNHAILLNKLYKYGFRGQAYKLIKSYLVGRKQTVRIDHYFSRVVSLSHLVEWCPVTCGVPQGTILGPLFFVLYINDLFAILPEGKLVSFADDTAITAEGKTWTEVVNIAEVNLNVVAKWLFKNHLSLNVAKTVFVTYGSYADSVPSSCGLRIHKKTCNFDNCDCPYIQRVTVAKYLGIFIDYNIKWGNHITKTTAKLRSITFIFYKLSKILDTKQLMIIYYAFFWSLAVYGIVAWGGAYENASKPLTIIQKSIIRIIFGKDRRYPTEDLFRENNLITIKKYYLEKALLSNFSYLRNIYMELVNIKRVPIVKPPRVNKEISRRSYTYVAYGVFNEMNSDMKISLMTSNKDKKMLRQWLIYMTDEDLKKLLP